MAVKLMQDEDCRTTGGDPTVTGVTQSSGPDFSLLTQTPGTLPLLKKFISFSYQTASGMVSIDWVV